MLRITSRDRETEVTLLLEGKLLSAWRETFEEALAGARQSGLPVSLDLSRLDYADTEGIALLRQCLRLGIPLRGCSMFIQELLHTEFT